MLDDSLQREMIKPIVVLCCIQTHNPISFNFITALWRQLESYFIAVWQNIIVDMTATVIFSTPLSSSHCICNYHLIRLWVFSTTESTGLAKYCLINSSHTFLLWTIRKSFGNELIPCLIIPVNIGIKMLIKPTIKEMHILYGVDMMPRMESVLFLKQCPLFSR